MDAVLFFKKRCIWQTKLSEYFIIYGLSVSKAHVQDGISIIILEMCDSEIIDTILIIFENYIEPVLFPNV